MRVNRNGEVRVPPSPFPGPLQTIERGRTGVMGAGSGRGKRPATDEIRNRSSDGMERNNSRCQSGLKATRPAPTDSNVSYITGGGGSRLVRWIIPRKLNATKEMEITSGLSGCWAVFARTFAFFPAPLGPFCARRIPYAERVATETFPRASRSRGLVEFPAPWLPISAWKLLLY